MINAQTKAIPDQLTLRAAGPQDVPQILAFIRALAEYEKLAHEVVATEAVLHETLFGASPKAHVVLAELAGESVGFALYFYNFSTFLGKPGIYIEDLFVNPDCRGQGIGKALLRHLAAKVLAEGCGRLEWWVLDWNAPAIGFYEALGAQQMKEWTVCRVTGDALEKLAKVE